MLFQFWNILCVISFMLVIFGSENIFLQSRKKKFSEGGFVELNLF